MVSAEAHLIVLCIDNDVCDAGISHGGTVVYYSNGCGVLQQWLRPYFDTQHTYRDEVYSIYSIFCTHCIWKSVGVGDFYY